MTTQQFLLSAWDWNPIVIGISLLALITYGALVGFKLNSRSGFFVAAVALFFLTLASPVNELADGYLFSAHMLQHLLLLLVIPPLLLLSLPMFADAKGRSGNPVRWWQRIKFHPFLAWLGGLSAMWVWHERTLCNAATTVEPVRVIQIISLLVLGTVFWWPIVGPQMQRRLPPLLGVVYLFSACVGCTILGILITFAPVGVVCPVYMHPVDRLGILPLIHNNWGFTPGMDQQFGGLMMWVPACGIYISGVITLLARWYRGSDGSLPEAAPVMREPAVTLHEPQGRARHSVRAAAWNEKDGAQGTDAPYLPKNA